jgi:hypothetical protein
MDTSYPLYHTLRGGGLKKLRTKISQNNIDELVSFLNDVKTEDVKKVIVLLIAEHARYSDGYTFDPANFVLPYGITEDENGVNINIADLPIELKNILVKFSKLKTPDTV